VKKTPATTLSVSAWNQIRQWTMSRLWEKEQEAETDLENYMLLQIQQRPDLFAGGDVPEACWKQALAEFYRLGLLEQTDYKGRPAIRLTHKKK